jgi:hypothetical protein
LDRSSVVGSSGGYATLPNSFTLNDEENVVISEVYFRYSPYFSASIFTEKDVYRTAIFKPRFGALTSVPQ